MQKVEKLKNENLENGRKKREKNRSLVVETKSIKCSKTQKCEFLCFFRSVFIAKACFSTK